MGASGIYSLIMVIATNLVPRANYAKYMAIMSTVFAVASVVGPILGGAISTHSTWRWVFLLKCAKMLRAVRFSYRNSNTLTWTTVLRLVPYRLSLWLSTCLHLSRRNMYSWCHISVLNSPHRPSEGSTFLGLFCYLDLQCS